MLQQNLGHLALRMTGGESLYVLTRLNLNDRQTIPGRHLSQRVEPKTSVKWASLRTDDLRFRNDTRYTRV